MVRQLNLQKIITSNLLSENEYYQRLNVTIDQLIQSTEIHYIVLIDTLQTLLQADQPFIISNGILDVLSINTKIEVQMLENEYRNATVPSVSCRK